MPVIRSRNVVTPEGVRPAAVEFGPAIERVGRWDEAPLAIDYGELVIMPGLVDSHVHVNEPGRTEWEGFATATRAAAAGGITTIVDMPLNSIPATTTLAALQAKVRALDGQCRVDVALWGGVVPGNTSELRPMLAAGARGFKCFLVPSGVDEFPHVGPNELREAARELAPTGAPLLVHAELPGPIEAAAADAAGADPEEYSTYLRSRPPAAEDAAIALLRDVCAETGARIHVVHLSSAGALEIIRAAQAEGLPLTAETTPHYLHFEAEAIQRGRCEFKCAPPIRERENRERLWRGLAAGTIGLVVSDHSPCTPELKRGDFSTAWGGIASLQFVLPVVWTEAGKRGFGLEDLVRWLCEGPARLAGLEQKGAIAPGRDADFAIWSPEEQFVVDENMIEHRHKVTPYRGETLQGVVRETWVRGKKVYANGHGVIPSREDGEESPSQ
ncbi:MAG TPA: allantoinase AllB [Thermoanaerobaculia bacterium]|nr:allantoinase AllB [Thermoanaerobaculia bacterium]